MTEAEYQTKLIRKLKIRFPGCVIHKNDPDSNYQGIPDLTVLFRLKWAALEVKASAKAPHRPNQKYYIKELNALSYAATIFPENEEEILLEMEHAFVS